MTKKHSRHGPSFKDNGRAGGTQIARRQELLAGFSEHAAQHLIDKHGLTLETAGDIGNELADWLMAHYGGQYVYFSKEPDSGHSERDREIFASMRRGNANELAAKYGLSFVRIYQIYQRMVREMRRNTEPQLFGAEEPEQP